VIVASWDSWRWTVLFSGRVARANGCLVEIKNGVNKMITVDLDSLINGQILLPRQSRSHFDLALVLLSDSIQDQCVTFARTLGKKSQRAKSETI
jgi:hypothetical protein